MLSKMHSAMKHDEAGQALVLGAATLIILALSVLVTIQIGHVIQKRIAVQNAADNSAFSVAAVVARSLNAIAWMNRTIVSHYVSMMALQSIVSALNGLHALIGIVSDLLQSLASAICIIAKIVKICCDACSAIPFVGPALAAAACTAYGVLTALYKGVEFAANGLRQLADNVMYPAINGLDRLIAPIVMLISKLNRIGMYWAQQGMKAMTIAALGSMALGDNFQKRIIQETVPGANVSGTTATVYNVAMGALNAAVSYRGMFDWNGSERLPDNSTQETDDSPGRKPAARMMAEIANATRTGTGDLRWETFRGIDGSGGGFLDAALEFAGFDFKGSTRLVRPMPMDTFREESGSALGTPSAPDAGACQAKQDRCNEAQQKCRDKNTEYEAAEGDAVSKEGQCSANTSACGSCSDSNCQACKDKPGACSAAQSARSDANAKKRAAESACNDTESVCKDVGEGCSASLPSQGPAWGGKKNFVFMNGGGSSLWSRGGALASAEFVKAFGIISYISGGGGGKYVGIQAAAQSGDSFHCFYGKGQNGTSCDGGKARKKIDIPIGCPWYAWTCPIVCDGEGHRHKYDGISPYLSFELKDEPTSFFNQPTYWGLVNLPPKDARFPPKTAFGFGSGGKFELKSFGNGREVGRLEGMDSPGLTTSLGEGLNGWARSQVYYHRPGYWAEPPNLFNPYWRAKLAPVAPAFSELLGNFGAGAIGGPLQDLVTQVLTH